MKKITSVLNKVPIVKYVSLSFIKTFLITAVISAILYFVLWITQVYSRLETMLDLKYNSPIISVPIWSFIALFAICLLVGFLMYFHKYKRGKAKTDFYKAVAPAIGKK